MRCEAYVYYGLPHQKLLASLCASDDDLFNETAKKLQPYDCRTVEGGHFDHRLFGLGIISSIQTVENWKAETIRSMAVGAGWDEKLKAACSDIGIPCVDVGWYVSVMLDE